MYDWPSGKQNSSWKKYYIYDIHMTHWDEKSGSLNVNLQKTCCTTDRGYPKPIIDSFYEGNPINHHYPLSQYMYIIHVLPVQVEDLGGGPSLFSSEIPAPLKGHGAPVPSSPTS